MKLTSPCHQPSLTQSSKQVGMISISKAVILEASHSHTLHSFRVMHDREERKKKEDEQD